MQHHLAPLLKPRSVALVGASERARSLGRTVFENLLAGSFDGVIEPVNPRHRRVLGRPAHASLGAIGRPIDLAIIAAPPAEVPGILRDPRASIEAAVLMSFPDMADAAARDAWRTEVGAIAKARGIRIAGPGAFGVIRTDIGLNATFCAPAALPGRLALVSQSGAVCTAMLDFAQPLQLGFSTVISTGGGIDIGFGEILDALVVDPATDGILLYIEDVGDARTLMSALRAAARVKPVVVLKAGRSLEISEAGADAWSIMPDTVFSSAMTRAGTVRVHNYTQLFAAARILAQGRIPAGNRLAIVSNGRGPGLLAADWLANTEATLAQLAPPTVTALDAYLPPEMARGNPLDVRGDATPDRFAAVVATVLADPGTDAVLAIHVPRPVIDAVDAAAAVAAVAVKATKPLLGAWLGALDRKPVHDALEAGGVPNFYSPENAVDAFAFVAAYRRNQAWLLEVPASQAEIDAPDYAAAERIRERALARGKGLLPAEDTLELMHAFGIEAMPSFVAETLAEAQAAARKCGYPVRLELEGTTPPIARTGIVDGRVLARAYGGLLQSAATERPPHWTGRVVVRRSPRSEPKAECTIVLTTDRVFGPVIVVASPAGRVCGPKDLMLAPLNRRLATDLLANAGIPAQSDALVHLLLRISGIACALPWVSEVVFDHVAMAGHRLTIPVARMLVDPARGASQGYRHMAIHPYPVAYESTITTTDGTVLEVRPVRPEDVELERRFVASLSERTRFFRFFYRLHELSPAMLARFTQVDYDRELALLALHAGDAASDGVFIVGIARFSATSDRDSAEFAVVVGDAWHGQGVGGQLMRALIAAARDRGLRRLVGTVLRENQGMVRFSKGLGFTVTDDPEDAEQVHLELELR